MALPLPPVPPFIPPFHPFFFHAFNAGGAVHARKYGATTLKALGAMGMSPDDRASHRCPSLQVRV